MIPPGSYKTRVPVTDQLEIPSDTTIHYVTAHLHPYAKSVSLIDKTDGVTLFTIESTDFEDRRGVARMAEWKSADGVPIARSHEYELLTEYDNPTRGLIDAMSILYIYALDRQFEQVHTPAIVADHR